MENKVYFEVENSNGNIEKMELLLQLRLEEFDRNYIIYKSCDNNLRYYSASYDGNDDNNFSNLNTDLSDKEKEILNEVFNKMKDGEFKDA